MRRLNLKMRLLSFLKSKIATVIQEHNHSFMSSIPLIYKTLLSTQITLTRVMTLYVYREYISLSNNVIRVLEMNH